MLVTALLCTFVAGGPMVFCPAAGAAVGTGSIADTIRQARKVGWVRLADTEPGGAPLDHPVQLDPAALGRVLAGITVEYPELERTYHVFAADEIAALAPALVRTLASAGPDQDVVFATSAARRLTLLGNKPTVNTGRVFVENGRFNLIAGHVNEGYTKQLTEDGYVRDFEPGTRVAPLGAHEAWYLDSRSTGWRRRREDWLAVEVPRSSGPLPLLAAGQPASRQPSGAAATPAAAPPPAHEYDRLKRRMQVLKELHEDGLITDEEYERKRGELLDEL